MEIEKAFGLLGLSMNATEDDVQNAYHAKAKITHPDTGGDSEKQKILNEAREQALAYCKIRNAVIPVNSSVLSRAIQLALNNQTATSAADQARAIQQRTKRSIDILKWGSWIFAGVTGALALFEKHIPTLLHLPDNIKYIFSAQVSVLAITFGFIGLVLQLIATRNRNKIDDFLESVSDKKECAFVLAEALNYSDVQIIRESDIQEKVTRINSQPIQALFPFFDLNPSLRPVLLAKAVQHGLLIPEKETDLTPEFVQDYSLHFKPSLFKPPPSPPPIPETPASVRSDFITTVILFAVFAGPTSYLAVFKASLWSILPGLLALGFGIVSFDALKKLRKFKKDGLGAQMDTADKPASSHES